MTAPLSLQRELDAARDASLAAGEVVMRHFRRPEEVRFKAPDQPVTAADLAADRLLRDRLSAAFPDYGWLSEETADSRDRLERSRVWIVDPIDGTNSFVEGRPEFVVSVGLAEDGEAVLGVLYNPVTGELYHAVRGGGAFLNGAPMRVTGSRVADEPGLMLVSRSELERGELMEYRERWRFLPLGSTAYRMAKIAEGTAHVFVSAGVKSEWDVCAASRIVEEAGGVARQFEGGALRFNQPVPRLQGLVVTNGEHFAPLAALPDDGAKGNQRRTEP